MTHPVITALLNFFFPPLCHICRSFIADAGELHICPHCHDLLTPIASPLCTICGIPFIGAGDDHLCGKCCKNTYRFDAARAACLYDGKLRELIHTFKYNARTHLRRPLALLTIEALEEYIRSSTPDLIVAVPLHRKRLRKRGFNQAILLGDVLSRYFKIPLERNNLQRTRWTEPQVTLTSDERRANVKDAFALRLPERVSGRRVLLIDDVFTTGSTVDECSRVLKHAGASRVVVVTVARTP